MFGRINCVGCPIEPMYGEKTASRKAYRIRPIGDVPEKLWESSYANREDKARISLKME